MPNNMSPKFKRTQYWVSGRFQGKYVGLILLLTFLTAALCSYVVYYTSMVSFGEKLANIYPQGRLVSAVNIINIRIIMSVLLISPLVALIGVYLSHKIAGPILRMERFMNDMASGNFTGKLVLRKGDELLMLADGINRLMESIKTTMINEKSGLERLEKELSNLKVMAISKHPDINAISDLASRMDSEIISLRKEIDRFKV
ncbi:MAG: hypothetical protein NTZ95_07805 [Candidatus Omnitrophica bacterium]|nr:hypothetical protein [Candidatus Omnitrophota bacterium]